MKKVAIAESRAFTPPTKEQIDLWKEKYGFVFELETDDDKVAWIWDPLSSITVMKLAYAALDKSNIHMVQAILNNCWLCGDESVKTDESYATGLVDQLNEILDLPNPQVKKVGDDKYRITVEGLVCEVRRAVRKDILKAERKNQIREPFETNIALMDLIKISGVDEIKEKSTRAYLGLLTAVEKVKNKTNVAVKKH